MAPKSQQPIWKVPSPKASNAPYSANCSAIVATVPAPSERGLDGSQRTPPRDAIHAVGCIAAIMSKTKDTVRLALTLPKLLITQESLLLSPQ
mmetsp:Transcript_9122/g.12255  ORF Transcript_9122/g.12255 Transcript_9122/m.12255 type:complete len:92 (+) Transcript_9122:46-321(+)